VARLLLVTMLAALAVAGPLSQPAAASRYIRYGIQDDAWLLAGSGTLDARLERLERLGVELVRVNLRWNETAPKRPVRPASHLDPAYRWARADTLLKGLREHDIGAVVTLLGTPRWANGGRSPNWAPATPTSFASFAYAVANRYPFVREWVIWNEPNQRLHLRPTTARTYVRALLNPAYDAIHRVDRSDRVAGGATAPRGGIGGVSPVAWIRGMRASGARLDAYAHHPHPLRPSIESPLANGCTHCQTITMATLDRLLGEVGRAWGAKRIWLTEYGYQTNPPDRWLGVSQARQARFIGEAAMRAYRAPRVDMLIHFLVRDEVDPGRWQSGLFNAAGSAKLAAAAYPLPLAQVARRRAAVALWGQVRPGGGRHLYRVRIRRAGRWTWAGGTRRTDARGFLSLSVAAPRGAVVQLSARGSLGAPLALR
jgi:hypothetical protein